MTVPVRSAAWVGWQMCAGASLLVTTLAAAAENRALVLGVQPYLSAGEIRSRFHPLIHQLSRALRELLEDASSQPSEPADVQR